MKRLLCFCVLTGCGTAMSVPDAGRDAGAVDAGVDAGTCLDPDAGPPFDAGGLDAGDFSCLGQPLPITAVSQLSIAGFITAAGLARPPVLGAQVELFDEGGTRIGSTLTDFDGGTYAFSTDIACSPFAGSLKASKPDAGFFDAYYYPPAPWRRNRAGLEVAIFDTGARNLVTAIAVVTVQPNTGALALAVEDCIGLPLSGATVTSNPAGTVRYVAASGLPLMSEMSTSSKGQLLIFNLPPGQVTLTATAAGQTFRTRTVTVVTDAITATTLQP